MDSFPIPVVTDDHAFIVDAVKIGVPRGGCIQLLPGFGLSVPDKGLGEKIVRIPEFIEVSDHVILVIHPKGQGLAVGARSPRSGRGSTRQGKWRKVSW